MSAIDSETGTAGNPRVSLTGYATASAWAHLHAHWFDSRRAFALIEAET